MTALPQLLMQRFRLRHLRLRGVLRGTMVNLSCYLDPVHHRTCFNNFFLVERWDPEAALRQKAQRLLCALRRRTGIKEIVVRAPYRCAVGARVETGAR